MAEEIQSIVREGENAEALLYNLNQQISIDRPQHLEGAQQIIAALHGGRYTEVVQFVSDGELEDELKALLGDQWPDFETGREAFMNTMMTPEVWQGSEIKKKLDDIVVRIWTDPVCKEQILKRYQFPESGSIH